jgi:hypothetical protein
MQARGRLIRLPTTLSPSHSIGASRKRSPAPTTRPRWSIAVARFQYGHSDSPAVLPSGGRNKLGEDFLAALAPRPPIKIVAALLPEPT